MKKTTLISPTKKTSRKKILSSCQFLKCKSRFILKTVFLSLAQLLDCSALSQFGPSEESKVLLPLLLVTWDKTYSTPTFEWKIWCLSINSQQLSCPVHHFFWCRNHVGEYGIYLSPEMYRFVFLQLCCTCHLQISVDVSVCWNLCPCPGYAKGQAHSYALVREPKRTPGDFFISHSAPERALSQSFLLLSICINIKCAPAADPGYWQVR